MYLETLRARSPRWLKDQARWLLLVGSVRVRVDGESMWPALRDGDRLLVSRLIYRLGPPRRGDIVLIRDPGRPGYECIKRLVALPGELVDSATGAVVDAGVNPRSSQAQRLGPDQYFVLGDNRAASRDSRSFGPVRRSQLLGRVWRRYGRR